MYFGNCPCESCGFSGPVSDQATKQLNELDLISWQPDAPPISIPPGEIPMPIPFETGKTNKVDIADPALIMQTTAAPSPQQTTQAKPANWALPIALVAAAYFMS